jgi:8-oxo-dGTP diphosphatase
MTARAPVDVAVGVLIRPDGRFLLASRPSGKPYAGYWEFPGGKLEPGETVPHALQRELHEELGIDLGEVYPWVVRVFDYPHARVRLHFCRVFAWRGQLHAREQQRYGFYALDDVPAPLLPATVPVLRWLELPRVIAISCAARLGIETFLARVDGALARGLKQLQLREPDLPADAVRRLFGELRARACAFGARLLVSSRHDPALWQQADGVHLTADALAQSRRRPDVSWAGASVHEARELARAAELGLDYAILGPVRETASHPGRAPLGWASFRQLAAASEVPLYAIGGLQPADTITALSNGGHGVAILSAAWTPGQCFSGGEAASAAGGVASDSPVSPGIA